MKTKKICCIIGTRPEVVKMAPIILGLKTLSWANVDVISTAQHRSLLDDMLKTFHIEPEYDLNVMTENQTLASLTGDLCKKLDSVISQQHYDALLVQGDTTTTLVGALLAFYRKIPCGHIEAGLRSFDLSQPFPEEFNRTLVSKMATWHFVPTAKEQQNLLNEQVTENSIIITGNTVIDAIQYILAQPQPSKYPIEKDKRLILVTSHRRENWGEPLAQICQALIKITELFQDTVIVYPVHPNPNVQNTAYSILAGHARIKLVPPLSYQEFAVLMKDAYLILTDSGGIQEEAPALGKPVLVLRDTTERPEIISAGVGMLVGTNTENIVNNVARLLEDQELYNRMSPGISPYGDGRASERIINFIEKVLHT